MQHAVTEGDWRLAIGVISLHRASIYEKSSSVYNNGSKDTLHDGKNDVRIQHTH